MPMMFPVQTNMKAYLSFYKVPLRTLWKDDRDWISSPNDSTNNLEPPYIAVADDAFNENSLMGVSGLVDYLGVPVTSLQGDTTGSFETNTDPKLKVPSNGYSAWSVSGTMTSFADITTPLSLNQITSIPLAEAN